MSKIDIGQLASGEGAVALDIETLIETRLLVQAQSGGGKTTLLRRVLEQSHGLVQQLVIDPEGELYTLREKHDYIIAGKGGDCAADPRSAKLLARRLIEVGVSAICDLSELKAHDRVRFVRLFLEALIEAPRSMRRPVLVVIDEAHLFAPEKGQAESAPAVIDLCTRGRKRGLCALLATQRLSKLHKDAAAELRNVLIGATGLDIDQQRAGDVLGFAKAERLALRDLKWREFYAYGPALSPGVIRLTVGDTATKSPKLGAGMAPPAQPSAKVRALLAKVADLPAEAEQEARDIEGMRRELAGVRRELTLAKKAQPAAEAKPCDHEREIERLETPIDEKERELASMERWGAQMQQAWSYTRGALEAIGRDVTEALSKVGPDIKPLPPVAAKRVERARSAPSAEPRGNHGRNNSAPRPAIAQANSATGDVTPAQLRILRALRRFEPLGVDELDKIVVAALSGVPHTSGGYKNNLGALRSGGYIAYPQPSYVALTDAGRDAAGDIEGIRDLEELHAAWERIVTPAQWRIVGVLIDAYPGDVGRDELAAAVDVPETSGGYKNNLGRLRTLGAIDYPSPGRVAATTRLFPEALQ